MSQAFRFWLGLLTAVGLFTLLLWAIGAPSPPLFGGLAGAILVALRHETRAKVPPWLFRIAQALIGATVAAQIDTESLNALGDHWAIVAGVTVATLVVSVGLGQVLILHGVSPITAAFASVAGGASGMTALASDYGADDRIVVVVQCFRVLFILLSLPWVVAFVFEPASLPNHSANVQRADPNDYLYAALAVGLGPLTGRLARLPSPALLGSLMVGAVLGIVGPIGDAAVPTACQAAAFLLIGVQAGIRFTPDMVRSLAKMLPAVLVMVSLLVVVCACMGLLLAAGTGESRLDGYLATSPGGLPVVLATVSDTSGDVTFVSAVQLVRVLSVLTLLPVGAAILGRWGFGHSRLRQ